MVPCGLGENIRLNEYLMSWLYGPAGGDDQEGAEGQGPHNGSFLQWEQRGQISRYWEDLHKI